VKILLGSGRGPPTQPSRRRGWLRGHARTSLPCRPPARGAPPTSSASAIPTRALRLPGPRRLRAIAKAKSQGQVSARLQDLPTAVDEVDFPDSGILIELASRAHPVKFRGGNDPVQLSLVLVLPAEQGPRRWHDDVSGVVERTWRSSPRWPAGLRGKPKSNVRAAATRRRWIHDVRHNPAENRAMAQGGAPRFPAAIAHGVGEIAHSAAAGLIAAAEPADCHAQFHQIDRARRPPTAPRSPSLAEEWRRGEAARRGLPLPAKPGERRGIHSAGIPGAAHTAVDRVFPLWHDSRA